MFLYFVSFQNDQRGWKELGQDHGLNVVSQEDGDGDFSTEPDDLKEARGKMLTSVRTMRSGAMQIAQGLQTLEEAVKSTPLAALHPTIKKIINELKVNMGRL